MFNRRPACRHAGSRRRGGKTPDSEFIIQNSKFKIFYRKLACRHAVAQRKEPQRPLSKSLRSLRFTLRSLR